MPSPPREEGSSFSSSGGARAHNDIEEMRNLVTRSDSRLRMDNIRTQPTPVEGHKFLVPSEITRDSDRTAIALTGSHYREFGRLTFHTQVELILTGHLQAAEARRFELIYHQYCTLTGAIPAFELIGVQDPWTETDHYSRMETISKCATKYVRHQNDNLPASSGQGLPVEILRQIFFSPENLRLSGREGRDPSWKAFAKIHCNSRIHYHQGDRMPEFLQENQAILVAALVLANSKGRFVFSYDNCTHPNLPFRGTQLCVFSLYGSSRPGHQTPKLALPGQIFMSAEGIAEYINSVLGQSHLTLPVFIHGTSQVNANSIQQDGEIVARKGRVYFYDLQNSLYGDALLFGTTPNRVLKLDTMFAAHRAEKAYVCLAPRLIDLLNYSTMIKMRGRRGTNRQKSCVPAITA